jgi:transposase-like protein
MSRRPRGNHSPAFKAKGEYTLTELAKWHDMHPNRITRWKTQLIERMAEVFERPAASSEPPVDVKALHTRIGELTLENDFLEGAPTKAGLLRAKK